MADSFDVIVARKLSGGGGGGGSSDFSTAQVTIYGNNADTCLPFCIDQGDMTALFNVRQTYFPGTYEIALWKGATLIEIYNKLATVETNGNIEDLSGGMYLITGVCAITIS